MENREQTQLHEACAVPYRLSHLGVEFCLVSQVKVNRWEFPKVAAEHGAFSPDDLLHQVAVTAGADGKLEGDEPLAQFMAARGGAAHCTSAYLMQVTKVLDAWPGQPGRRRLWCLAEEARMRLRRKPLRRLVDLALHSLTGKRDEANVTDELRRRPR